MYFTIQPLSYIGFTDQLLTFSSFYKLGQSLGLKYVHTPFFTTRSPNEIYAFLGFKQKFQTRNLLRQFLILAKYKYVDLILSEAMIQDHNIQTLEQLNKYLQSQIQEIKQKSSRVIIRFKSDVILEYLHLIESEMPDFPNKLDLYSSYRKYSQKYRKSQLFSLQTTKLLIHIRLGDTAIIRTPWNSVIPLWHPQKPALKSLTEFERLENSGFEDMLEVEDYYIFIKQLFNSFETQNFSIVVSSDGYRRTLETFLKKSDTLGLPNDKIQAIQQKLKEDDQQQFQCFQSFNEVTCLVGETNQNLYQLVDASLTADIIIIGTQQKMIPKLLSCYGNREKHPIIILLGKQEKQIENYQQTMYLSLEKATIIPVNLTSESFEDSLKTIVNEIEHQQSLIIGKSHGTVK